MDTSEKYILMCSKAQEIQEDKISKVGWGDGDFYCVNNKVNNFNQRDQEGHGEVYWGKPIIWLPRQDQLQDMIMSNYGSSLDLLCNFQLFFMDDNDSESFNMYFINYSFEQLWLTFVMREKFNKVWSEEHEIWYNA